jgi:UDP-hydrolysing UDP-N-acetyl-D-glucosamine 2-epimerase
MVRTIGVVTVSRSDYGVYLPILKAIEKDPGLHLHLIVAGMHLSSEFGCTVDAIKQDGFDTSEQIEMALSSDSAAGVCTSMGLGAIGFGQSFSRKRPDILLVLGDRFEMHAGALSALPFKIPVAHIHGGEITEGAIDDALRHSITKLSHLHFVATEDYARRVQQLGEQPWRIVVSGAPSLDNLKTVDLLSRPDLESQFGLNLDQPFLLVTYHPVTLEPEDTEARMREFLSALDELGMATVFTYPNADPQGRLIIRLLEQFAEEHENAAVAVNLGTQAYFSMMKLATAMVGNSSSGIVEAPSFRLPVVNIGNRQRGRIRARNIIDVGNSRTEIVAGLKRAIDREFRESLAGMINPYGDGDAAEKIVETLRAVELNDKLFIKHFHDM